MGYFVRTEESRLRIRAEDKERAYRAVCAINAPEYNHLKRGGSVGRDGEREYWYSWMPADYPSETETLEDVLELLGFQVDHDLDESGDIVGLGYDNKRGAEDIFLLALAPYIEDGSRIVWVGEDGERWSWRFQDGTMRRHGMLWVELEESSPIEYYAGFDEAPDTHGFRPVELGVLA